MLAVFRECAAQLAASATSTASSSSTAPRRGSAAVASLNAAVRVLTAFGSRYEKVVDFIQLASVAAIGTPVEAIVVHYVQTLLSPRLLLSWARALTRDPNASNAEKFRQILQHVLPRKHDATVVAFLARQVSVLGAFDGGEGGGGGAGGGGGGGGGGGASSATTPLGDAQEQVKAALLISSLLPFVSAGSPALPPLHLANLLQLSKQCVSAATGGWGNDGHSDGEAARHCAEILGWACFVLNVCKDSYARLHPPPPLSGDDGNARSTPAIYDWLTNKIGDVFRACVSSRFALREVRLYVVVFDYRDTVGHTSD